MKRSPLAFVLALFAVSACEDAAPPSGPTFATVPLLAVGSNILTGDVQAGQDAVFPSTNAINNTNGWGRVLFVDAAVGAVTLNFVSSRAFYSCFEYRIDDEAPTSAANGGNNWNPLITDGMWLYTCQSNSSLLKTIAAQNHVDIRLSFGAESDERFNWTRFYVLPGYALTLHDEAGNPLGGQAGVFKYRCGGSWAPSVAFTTDANGKFSLEQPACANWDKKVTVTVNQTSQEQDVTVNPVFQTAKVNANLESCAAPITATPGGTVDQGGGYWFSHGTTGPTGTVTFYTFPGSIKLRMSYNHMAVTKNAVPIAAGTNEVDFQTTAVTLNSAGAIKSPTGGSWWFFAKPTMDLLPGNYSFLFQNGTSWSPAVPLTVSGCDMNAANLRVVDENGNGVAGAKATPAVGGAWQAEVPGATNAGGYLFAQLPTGTTKVKMVVNQGGQEQTSAQMVASGYTWITEILRIGLNDHAGVAITTGANLEQGGGFWYNWGALGAYRDIQVFPGSYKFKVTYNFTSQEQSGIAVSAGAGVTPFYFQTGQALGACITQYSTGVWRTFTSGMEMMPGSYTFRLPSQTGVITAGGITSLLCP